ncbi:MAG: hypothetical protein SCI25_07185 [Desulfuromonadales bacterium]|nr:hypothetical protein [Desulfuromonadales bacterium]MDW7756156.1 hypothetical protein [Desulfuromonadales bacterium]
MDKKISPHEKGILNAKNYAKYVKGLEENGKQFPVNQFGEVNKEAVAAACGFNRQVFNPKSNKKMADRLAADVDRIGIEGEYIPPQAPGESEGALARRAKKSAETVSKLRKDLAIEKEKVTSLEVQIKKLEYELDTLKQSSAEQKNSFDFMVSTGRRFTL